jgi:hypothetical protein
MVLTADDAILFTVRISAVGVIITSLELVLRAEVVAPNGLMSWHVSRIDKPWMIAGRRGRLADAVFGAGLPFLLSLRLAVAALCLVAPAGVVLSAPVIASAALLVVSLSVRSPFGLNGADQLDTIIYGGLALVMLHRNPTTERWYIWFLAAQCCLAYGVAGVAKARSPVWRDGTGLQRILGVRSYVGAGTARFAEQHARIILLLSWATIGWECSFWTVLLLPQRLALLVLAGGIAFHVIIGFVMGLNDFIWAFLALYPAIICLRLR